MAAKETWQEREAREQTERTIVAATIAMVADLLHATIDDREGHALQLRAPDYTVHIYHNTWKSRLHLSGSFPPDLARHRVQSGSHAAPECAITVSATRPAQQVAREIERRIAPVYRELYTVLAERAAKYNKAETAKENQADRIAYAGRGERLGERDPWRRHDYYPTRYVTFGGKRFSNQPCGEAEITGIHEPSISMKLYNLTPDLAEYIASLLGEWAEE
jgi:hypothetical protein